MLKSSHILFDFKRELYEKLSSLNSGVSDLELYEFGYALNNIQPKDGDWTNIDIPSCSAIEQKITDSAFYENIQLKPEENCKIAIDKSIIDLNRSLFSGIVNKIYDLHWVDQLFYFDVRGFLFLPRTVYFTESILSHLGEKPYLKFKKRQSNFDSYRAQLEICDVAIDTTQAHIYVSQEIKNILNR